MAALQKRDDFDAGAFLERIQAVHGSQTFPAQHLIYAQGDEANAVYYLQKGKVKKSVTSEQGKDAVLAILEPGTFFGEGCMIGQKLRLTTVTTMTECTVIRLEKSAMNRLLHEGQEFTHFFIRYLMRRNRRTEEDLVNQLFNSSEKRLARTLLLLANFGKESKPEPIIAKLSQETLAEMIGTTRARVSFFMNKFRRLGLIEYDGRTMQVNVALLNMVLRDGLLETKAKRPEK